MEKLPNQHTDKLRFGLVGIANTAIDFSLLFILVALGLLPIISNMISTASALTFSFFANKNYTFKDKSQTKNKKLVAFLVITLFGLWVLQPIIIWLIQLLLDYSHITLLIAKLIATMASLTWNYLMYRKYVFIK